MEAQQHPARELHARRVKGHLPHTVTAQQGAHAAAAAAAASFAATHRPTSASTQITCACDQQIGGKDAPAAAVPRPRPPLWKQQRHGPQCAHSEAFTTVSVLCNYVIPSNLPASKNCPLSIQMEENVTAVVSITAVEALNKDVIPCHPSGGGVRMMAGICYHPKLKKHGEKRNA